MIPIVGQPINQLVFHDGILRGIFHGAMTVSAHGDLFNQAAAPVSLTKPPPQLPAKLSADYEVGACRGVGEGAPRRSQDRNLRFEFPNHRRFNG